MRKHYFGSNYYIHIKDDLGKIEVRLASRMIRNEVGGMLFVLDKFDSYKDLEKITITSILDRYKKEILPDLIDNLIKELKAGDVSNYSLLKAYAEQAQCIHIAENSKHGYTLSGEWHDGNAVIHGTIEDYWNYLKDSYNIENKIGGFDA